jgi:peptide/nickel transport system substrate-binding protein
MIELPLMITHLDLSLNAATRLIFSVVGMMPVHGCRLDKAGVFQSVAQGYEQNREQSARIIDQQWLPKLELHVGEGQALNLTDSHGSSTAVPVFRQSSKKSLTRRGLLTAALASHSAFLTPATTFAAPARRTHQDLLRLQSGTTGGKLAVGWGGDFNTLDPHVNSSGGFDDSIIMWSAFDRLIERSPGGRLYPGLAREWSVSEDGLRWSLKLREGVKFHDGTDFNAEAVKVNLDRIADPATKSPYAIFALGPYASCEVIDQYTIELQMTRVYTVLPTALSTYGLGMVSPAAIEQYGSDLGRHLVSTGPFLLKEWVPRDHLTLIMNPEYDWASDRQPHGGRPYLDEVTIYFIPDDATRATAFESGQIDMAAHVAPADWRQFEEAGNFLTTKIPMENYPPAGSHINVSKFPTDDVKVRQAIEHAINREEINEVFLEGTAVEADGIVSTFAWAYESDSALYQFDPAKASALLDESGWILDGDIRRKEGDDLEIIYMTYPNLVALGEVIQAQLQSVGFRVEIMAVDDPANKAEAQAGKHHLTWTYWEGVDPADLFKIFGAGENNVNITDGWNFSHYSVPELDQLFEEGEATLDQEARQAIYSEIQMRVMQDAAFIPLYNVTTLWAFDKALAGTETTDGMGASPLLYNIYWNQ